MKYNCVFQVLTQYKIIVVRFLCHTFLNLKSGKESKLQLKANLPGLEIKVCIPGFDPVLYILFLNLKSGKEHLPGCIPGVDPVQDQPADPRPERTPSRVTLRLLPR